MLQPRLAFGVFIFSSWFFSLPQLSSPGTSLPVVAVKTSVTGEAGSNKAATEQALVLPGVLIEEVSHDSILEKVGVQKGDVILSWERLPNPPANPESAAGRIESPFDWMWLELDQAPRGTVRLSGRRGSKEVRFEVPIGAWASVAALNLVNSSDPTFMLEHDGKVSLEPIPLSCDHPAIEAQKNFRAKQVLCTWRRLEVARQLGREGKWTEARSLLSAPIPLDLPVSLIALVYFQSGKLYERHGDVELAHEMYNYGLRCVQHKRRADLLACHFHFRLGYLELHRGNLTIAREHYTQSIQQLEQMAPRSLYLARSLRDLGLVEEQLGRYEEALRIMGRSLEIATDISLKSWDVATILNNIGVVYSERGDLLLAEDRFKAAAAMKEELRPADVDLAGTYSNLGLIRSALSDYESALRYYREALSVLERNRATGIRPRLAIQTVLVNLGNVLMSQGNFDAADFYLRQAVALFSETDSDSLAYAQLLKNMGNLAWYRNDYDKAEIYYLRSLDLWERKSPAGPGVASCLEGLGIVSLQRRQYERAEIYLQKALSWWEATRPESLSVASTLNNLGNLEKERGRNGEAKSYWLRALALRSKLVPGSALEAKLSFALGEEAFREGALEEAAIRLNQSMDSMESQFDRLEVDSLARGRYRFRKSEVYRLAAKIAAVRGKEGEVFDISERYRARSFLEILAGRVLRFYPDLPEAIELERLRIRILLRRNERDFAGLGAESAEGSIERLLAERQALVRSRDASNRLTGELAPRLANLENPRALDVHAAAGVLDEGMAIISYFDCGEHWYAMVLRKERGQVVYRLLRLGVVNRQQLSTLIQVLSSPPSAASFRELRARRIADLGGLLYRALIGPLESVIYSSSRLLIIPDGPLHYLPWGALIRDSQENGIKTRQYFSEWKPLHIAPSVTVFAEMKKSRKLVLQDRGGNPPFVPDFVAFGDAVYSSLVDEGQAKANVRIQRDGLRQSKGNDLEPLPWSRREVESIAELFPQGQARIFMGKGATEDEVKRLVKGTRIIHFATHAWVDDRLPLNSALALTVPGVIESSDNGLLQVWEIFETLRIDADLVVLSGCETALGEEQGGEGLIGLTRAFQYAGARTVMASLWSVQDRATSELMIRFYKHLRAGLTKDEALRQAQIELIRGPIEIVNEKGEKVLFDASAPYYWAGFQLYGDWQ